MSFLSKLKSFFVAKPVAEEPKTFTLNIAETVTPVAEEAVSLEVQTAKEVVTPAPAKKVAAKKKATPNKKPATKTVKKK